MKANALMIGDWVHYWILNINAKVNDIMSTGRLGIRFIDSKGKEGYIHGVMRETIKPIPLTAEILEKNGFVKQAFDGWRLRTENYTIMWRTDYGEPNLIIDSWSADYGKFNKFGISFVHELQHALRLCNIEREIIV